MQHYNCVMLNLYTTASYLHTVMLNLYTTASCLHTVMLNLYTTASCLHTGLYNSSFTVVKLCNLSNMSNLKSLAYHMSIISHCHWFHCEILIILVRWHQWSRNCLPFWSIWVHPWFLAGLCYSIFSFMSMFCRSLFDLFLLAIVLSVLLQLTDSDYTFGIFKLFL